MRPRIKELHCFWFLLISVVCLFAAVCQPQGGGDGATIHIEWIVTPDPPRTGDAMLSFTLVDSTAGMPVTRAKVRLEGNMSHPGMMPILSTARETAPGRYEAPLDFTMAGDWIVLVDAELPDGRALHRQIEILGVRPR
jgi:hypothetical protein